MKVTPYLALLVVAFAYSGTSHAGGGSAIELSKLIEAFMLPQGSQPEWSMGAGPSTPQIAWTSSGVEGRPDCGVYAACRRGTTRVFLNGKEMQHLRQRLEPVPWELFMSSNAPAKFGPERVEIRPSCDTVECYFDFISLMAGKGFSLTKLCEAGPGSFRQTGYEVKSSNKLSYVVVSESEGNGGASTSLTFVLAKPDNPQILCAEAKSAE